MKFISLALGMTSLITPLAFNATGDTQRARIVSAFTIKDIIGPSNGIEDLTAELYLTYPHDGQIICADYYNNKTGAYVISEEYEIVNPQDTLWKLNYTFKFAYRIPDGGLKIKFSTSGRGLAAKSCEILIYKELVETINCREYKNYPYIVENRTFSIRDSVVGNNKEQFQFADTVDYLSINGNYELDLNEIMFNFSGMTSLGNKDQDKYLRIQDTNDNFKYISKDKDGYINIPVMLNQKNKEVRVSFKNKMYYNPFTLDMSLNKRVGFEETNKFYISPKFFKDLESSKIELRMNKLGMNSLTGILDFRFESDRKFIGLCYDSTYCFEGGIRK